MLGTIIWGLTDVLIPGLHAHDTPADSTMRAVGDVILERLVVDDLGELYTAEMSEQEFCRRILDRAGWPTDVEHMQTAIRRHFRQSIPGTAEILAELAGKYRLILLADHAREWIDDIRKVHRDLLSAFERSFFSFDLRQTKAEPSSLRRVLDQIVAEPTDCLLIDANPTVISVAKNIGMDAILFRNASQLAQKLAARGIGEKTTNTK